MIEVSVNGILSGLTIAALFYISIIDIKTYQIPPIANGLIFGCGVIQLLLHQEHWKTYVFGFFIISVPLYLVFCVSKGKAVGGGDVKLMAVCGLFLGWERIIPAFFTGCMLGLLTQIFRRKRYGTQHLMAMGPFLSIGVILAMRL